MRSVAIIVLIIISWSPAFAEEEAGPYVSAKAGFSLVPSIDNNQGNTVRTSKIPPGLSSEWAVGYEFASHFRVEGEIGVTGNSVDSLNGVSSTGNVSAVSYLVNGYYDYHIREKWFPYIGAGIGGATIRSRIDIPAQGVIWDDNMTVLAYQVEAGFNIKLFPKIVFIAGYRYFATSDFDLRDTSGKKFRAEYEAHIIRGGFRIRF